MSRMLMRSATDGTLRRIEPDRCASPHRTACGTPHRHWDRSRDAPTNTSRSTDPRPARSRCAARNQTPPPARSYTPDRRASCGRSEEHTSELQSPCNLVCRLLLEKKNYGAEAPAVSFVHHLPTNAERLYT